MERRNQWLAREKKGRRRGGAREGRHFELEAQSGPARRAGHRAETAGRARSEALNIRRGRHHSERGGEPEKAFDRGIESEAWHRKKLWF